MRLRFFNTFDTATPFFRNLIPYLSSRCEHIEIILSKAQYRETELKEILAPYRNVQITQLWDGCLSERGAIGKLGIHLLYWIQASVKSLSGKKVDLNIFLTQPPLIGWLGLILRRIRGQQYILVLMDIYPDMLMALGIVGRKTFLYRLASHLALDSYYNARDIVVIGHCMKEKLILKNIDAQRIHVIQNWADEREIIPIKHSENKFRQSQPWKYKFVVMFAGNIGTPQQFNDLLAVAKQLRERRDIAFVFVGGGSRFSWLEQKIENGGLSNVFVYPFLHTEYSLSEIIGAGDVHFVSLREGVDGLAVPSKSYSIMAAGRPIVYEGNLEGEIARMILEGEMGRVVKLDDPVALMEVLLEYTSSPNESPKQGAKARGLIENKYSRKKRQEDYSKVIFIQ